MSRGAPNGNVTPLHEPGITKLVLASKSGLFNSFGIILFQIEAAL